MRVLVVDDEQSIRNTLCAFLERAGYEVDSAEDAQTACDMLSQKDYDVVVTDVIMPRLSGVDLLRCIRGRSETIQVIIMTGEPSVETAVEAVRRGAHDYLTKPVRRESLLRAVGQAARVKALIDEKEALERENRRYQQELEARVQARTEALQRAMQSIAGLLTTVVEVRDPYTAGHQRRVGNLAAAIAARLGLPPSGPSSCGSSATSMISARSWSPPKSSPGPVTSATWSGR